MRIERQYDTDKQTFSFWLELEPESDLERFELASFLRKTIYAQVKQGKARGEIKINGDAIWDSAVGVVKFLICVSEIQPTE